MYKITTRPTRGIEINNTYEGIPLEQKIRNITENQEPIAEEVPMIYTEKGDGVLPGYDIRTDRFEVAMEAMDKINRSAIAKGAEIPKAGGVDEEAGTSEKMKVERQEAMPENDQLLAARS